MSVRATPSSTGTITAILVDDERLAREELEFLLRDYPEVEVAAVVENGIQALEVIEKLEPDLVFLDVQMPGLDGLGIIRRLQEKQIPLPFFVMATAYDQYAIEAFRLEAVDYLLKPIEKNRLELTIGRVKRYLAEQAPAEPASAGTPRSKLVLRSQNKNLMVDVADLIYATIDDGLITITTTSMEGESTYKTIEELQSDLDPDQFWRVHRSYLVNLNRIAEVIPWFHSSLMLRMTDKKGTEVPVSRSQAKRLRAYLKM
jgi:two-component system, LytTR family, response regulator LytT